MTISADYSHPAQDSIKTAAARIRGSIEGNLSPAQSFEVAAKMSTHDLRLGFVYFAVASNHSKSERYHTRISGGPIAGGSREISYDRH